MRDVVVVHQINFLVVHVLSQYRNCGILDARGFAFTEQ